MYSKKSDPGAPSCFPLYCTEQFLPLKRHMEKSFRNPLTNLQQILQHYMKNNLKSAKQSSTYAPKSTKAS